MTEPSWKLKKIESWENMFLKIDVVLSPEFGYDYELLTDKQEVLVTHTNTVHQTLQVVQSILKGR